VLRSKRFWVPQWFNDAYLVAYYDLYGYPDPLPPFALGVLDFWWVDPEKEAALQAKGAL
jgi:microcin C transport system substrate-binding protein